MSLNLLLALPDSVACFILQDWLDLCSLVALDSAFGSKLEHDELLSLLRSNAFTLQKPSDRGHVYSAYYMSWIVGHMISSQHFYVGKNTDNNQICKYLQQCGAKITSLTLCEETADLLDAFITYCHNLTVLDVDTEIKDKQLHDMLHTNSNIVELNINIKNMKEGEESPFANIQLPNLRVLSCILSNSTALADVLQMSMGNLIKLSVRIEVIYDLSAIAQYCPLLRSLGFMGSAIDDITLRQIVESCTHIVNVDLSGTYITNAGIEAVTTHLPGLRSLNIMYCRELTNISLIHINSHCAKTLHTLYLNEYLTQSFDERILNALFAQCTQLQTLYWSTHNPTRIKPNLLHSLTTLLLQYGAVCNENLLHISKHCTNLHTLCVFWSKDIVSAKAITAVVTKCTALRYFYYCNSNITSKRLDIEAYLPHWREINPHLKIMEQVQLPCHLEFDVMEMPV